MDMSILKVIMLQSIPEPIQFVYQFTVSPLLECNCPAFKDMISKFGRKRNSFLHCKHLYFISIKVFNLDPDVDLFIHASTFSFNEVKLIFEGGLLTHSTSYNSSRPSTILCLNGCGHLWTSCVLKIIFHNKQNLMDYLYSLQNVALQYSTMSYVSPTIEHYMFNVTCLLFL